MRAFAQKTAYEQEEKKSLEPTHCNIINLSPILYAKKNCVSKKSRFAIFQGHVFS